MPLQPPLTTITSLDDVAILLTDRSLFFLYPAPAVPLQEGDAVALHP